MDDLLYGKEQYVQISDNRVDIWIGNIVNDKIFGFKKIDAEIKSEFKYIWNQFPPFIVKEVIDVSLMGGKMKMYYEKTKRVRTQNKSIAVTKHKRFKTFIPMIKFMINTNHFEIKKIRSALLYVPIKYLSFLATLVVDKRRIADKSSDPYVKFQGTFAKLLGNTFYGSI